MDSLNIGESHSKPMSIFNFTSLKITVYNTQISPRFGKIKVMRMDFHECQLSYGKNINYMFGKF
jgi:hypothetical protein